jgi:pimeloyl-ACP methyl ester carboxylesterase
MQREGSTTAYARWLPTLLAADEGARSRRSTELSAIRVPVRLVWGDRDTVTPPDQALRLERLFAAPPTIWVRGAGHIPHIEAPREFLLALDRALAQ